MRSVVITFDDKIHYVIDLFEGGVRINTRTVSILEIGSVVAIWLNRGRLPDEI